jgi:hypothetical protein
VFTDGGDLEEPDAGSPLLSSLPKFSSVHQVSADIQSRDHAEYHGGRYADS